MKLVDTNVLISAVNPSAAHHRSARMWMEHSLSGGAPVGFAWVALLGFLRITTLASVLPRPLTGEQAMTLVDQWLAAPSATVLHPGSGHLELLGRLLGASIHPGNLTNDAHLAALALEYRATVVTFDSDFGRFPGVRWESPR